MNTFNLRKEIPLWILIALPMVYLATIWESLPETVPTHFNAKGEADGWGSKNTLIWLSVGLTFGTYLLMTLIPKIDPKKKLEMMGKKYDTIKLILVLFMAIISCFIIYSAHGGSSMNVNWMFVITGAMFAVLENYFQSIKPNYFVGIRTPWTLESENVWKKTHRLAGRIWVPAGILLCFLPFLLDTKIFMPVFFVILSVITVIPLVYSYLEFQKEKK